MQLVVSLVAGLDVLGVVSHGSEGLLHLLDVGLRVVIDEDELLGLQVPLGRGDTRHGAGSLLDACLAHLTLAIDIDGHFLGLGLYAEHCHCKQGGKNDLFHTVFF